MLVGVVGAPNKGKTTFFSAATLVDAKIADYPFTTIEPNRGVAYVGVRCACVGLGVTCNARNSVCRGGTRLVPISMVDVAGLVPGAHSGRGMGNKFLDDLRQADALIQVVDATGKTDLEGKPVEWSNPAEEVLFLLREIDAWVAGIIKRNWDKIKGRDIKFVCSALSGFGVGEREIKGIVERLGLDAERIAWGDEEILKFAQEVRVESKPIVVAANKCDIPEARENAKKLASELNGLRGVRGVFPCSSAVELALRKGERAGVVSYVPGMLGFEILKGATGKQRETLEKIEAMVRENGTGVQNIIDYVARQVLRLLVVYPVEDENRFSDSAGSVLPDAYLVKDGTTALEFAGKIHTELQSGFLGAIDARTKKKVGKEYILKDGDIIKIIAR